MVDDLTTEVIMTRLRISRNRMSCNLASDYGTTLFGTHLELHWLVADGNRNLFIYSFLAENGIEWLFDSPAAPHHDGLYEVAAKGVQYHLRRIVRNESLSHEEFETVLAQVVAVLDSRPLCASSDDPSELDDLARGQFLVVIDLVLMMDNFPPLEWRLGRVVATPPGKDGLVRLFTLPPLFGGLEPPLKICPLLPRAELEDTS